MAEITRRKFVLFATRAITGVFLGIQAAGCLKFSALEKRIRELIAENKTISLAWNCGGDEAVITVLINNVESENTLMEELEIHVMNLLHLPDVGEFGMQGTAILLEEKGIIYIEFESFFLDAPDLDELFSGKKKLF
jgi:hypothetical protein